CSPGERVRGRGRGIQGNTVVLNRRTVQLPHGGGNPNAVVGTARRRLQLSNFSMNRIDVLNLRTYAFDLGNGVAVGAQPWGLFINAREDTLLVANSGGTNISFVPLETLREDVPRRLMTPNVALFEIPISVDATTGW